MSFVLLTTFRDEIWQMYALPKRLERRYKVNEIEPLLNENWTYIVSKCSKSEISIFCNHENKVTASFKVEKLDRK